MNRRTFARTFDPSRYRGVIPNRHWMAGRVLAGPVAADSVLPKGAEVNKWNRFINASDDQGQTGSCESRSFMGIMEVLIRFYVDPNAFSPDLQLDANRLHELAQQDRYPNTPYDPMRGLYMGDSFKAARRVGLVPPDAEAVPLDPTVAATGEALMTCPVHIGIGVPKSFGSPNPKTGEIKRVWITESYGGHALFIARLFAATTGRMPMWAIPNSWGRNWGWNGVCCIDHDFLRTLMLDAPMLYRFDYAAWFKTNREWEKWMVKG